MLGLLKDLTVEGRDLKRLEDRGEYFLLPQGVKEFLKHESGTNIDHK